jgi:hypothetical protein
LRPELEALMPPAVALLPRTKSGWPLPWFVARTPGVEPDLRLADHRKRVLAFREGLCWTCGAPLGRNRVFVGGPLSVANRTFSDWCSHEPCAEFAARACPALNGEMARRSGKAHPEGTRTPAGMAEGLVGVVALLYARPRVAFDRERLLFHPTPARVRWWSGGVGLGRGAAFVLLCDYLRPHGFSEDEAAEVLEGRA